MQSKEDLYRNGLKEAILALSYFRNRHVRRNLYAHSKRREPKTFSVYKQYTRLARHYIRKARKSGFTGSVVAAITALDGQG